MQATLGKAKAAAAKPRAHCSEKLVAGTRHHHRNHDHRNPDG